MKKNWLTRLFYKEKLQEETEVMNKFLIVGLGNIGSEYYNTRHNIGFKALDFLAEKENVSFENLKFGALTELKFKGRSFFLLKPNTFMNLSGKSVKFWIERENIPLNNVLIITDDLNLSFGTIRIRPKGSDGGHNGLKNISLLLNTQEYARFRFGISDEFKKGKQIDYVLGKWDDTEMEKLPERLGVVCEIIKSFGLLGLENTMTVFNGK